MLRLINCFIIVVCCVLCRPAPGPEVIYLRHVERAKPYLPPAEEDRIYPPPRFIVPLRDVHQIEGGRIHFEARIEPVGDPTMRVEWYVNGRVLEASKHHFVIQKIYTGQRYRFRASFGHEKFK